MVAIVFTERNISVSAEGLMSLKQLTYAMDHII